MSKHRRSNLTDEEFNEILSGLTQNQKDVICELIDDWHYFYLQTNGITQQMESLGEQIDTLKRWINDSGDIVK